MGVVCFATWQLSPGDDVDVDADRPGLLDDAAHDGASPDQFLPAAALAGADDDLGYLEPIGPVSGYGITSRRSLRPSTGRAAPWSSSGIRAVAPLRTPPQTADPIKWRGSSTSTAGRSVTASRSMPSFRWWMARSRVIACEFPSEHFRQWIEEGHPYVVELAAIRDVEYVDIPTGHWPQFTRPAELAQAIVTAVDRT
jgi:hypothetical protein